jgi:hypothetical protein
MSCCGKKRASMTVRSNPRHEFAPQSDRSQAQGLSGSVVEYVGATTLTVRGPVSGHMYRFSTSGACMVVDARDAPFLLSIPSLRKRQQPS